MPKKYRLGMAKVKFQTSDQFRCCGRILRERCLNKCPQTSMKWSNIVKKSNKLLKKFFTSSYSCERWCWIMVSGFWMVYVYGKNDLFSPWWTETQTWGWTFCFPLLMVKWECVSPWSVLVKALILCITAQTVHVLKDTAIPSFLGN